MRALALAVAAALTLTMATGCADRPRHDAGPAAPAGTPAGSESVSPTTSAAPAAETASPEPTSTGTTTTTTARCQTSQLSGSLELYEPPGQAGSTYQARVKLTNNGDNCTMSGFVDVRLLADGQPRETKVTRRNAPGQTVTLGKGDVAWVGFSWIFSPDADEADKQPLCGPRATGALVTPPGSSTPLRVTGNIGVVCRHGEIDLNPITKVRPS